MGIPWPKVGMLSFRDNLHLFLSGFRLMLLIWDHLSPLRGPRVLCGSLTLLLAQGLHSWTGSQNNTYSQVNFYSWLFTALPSFGFIVHIFGRKDWKRT